MLYIFFYHHAMPILEQMARVATEVFRKSRIPYSLTAYCKYEDALSYLNKHAKETDICFFDCSDMHIAVKMIRKLRKDNLLSSWVFTDGESANLIRSLILRPSGFIPDAENEQRLSALLEQLTAYHRTMERQYYFTFKCEGEYIRIPISEIHYLESDAKRATLHAAHNNSYCFTAKLDDLAARLPNHFLRCHQSYLVNLYAIKRLDTKNHTFLLESNEEILISRRLYTGVKAAYEQFNLQRS